MPLLPLAFYGDPILRKKTSPITEINDEIRELAKDMAETMHAHNGIGLAAPQIKRSISIFIIQVPKEIAPDQWDEGVLKVFINPKLSEPSQKNWIRNEGCLSIPGIWAPVERPISITVEALDLDGNLFKETFSDLEARTIMHENDHINGTLYIDRVDAKWKVKLAQPLKLIKAKYHKED